jgi:Tfp pilus assembly protein FimV
MRHPQDRQASIKLHVLGLAVAAALMPGLASAQAKDASTAELKEQVAKMQAQLLEQQKAMQQLQQRLSEMETTQSAQAAAPAAPAQAQPVTSADIPQAEAPSRIHRPPSAMPGVEEPPPSGYVRLGDSGNLLKLDVVAQTDMKV